MEKQLEKLAINPNDVIILKGDWDYEEVHSFSKLALERNMRNLMVILPEGKGLETMDISDFKNLMTEVQTRMNNNGKDSSEEHF